MAKTRKTWREKLADDKDLPRVVEITANMSQRWGTGTVVIPAPREVDEIMRSVPKGKLITINQIRERLAKRHGATIGCPITTGIFAILPPVPLRKQRPQEKKILLLTGGR